MTPKQIAALLWLYPDQSWRTWHGPFAPNPAIRSLESLVDRGFAVKRGGMGFTQPTYALLSAGIEERRKHQ